MSGWSKINRISQIVPKFLIIVPLNMIGFHS